MTKDKDGASLPDEAHVREIVSAEMRSTSDPVDTEDVTSKAARDPLVIPYRRIRAQSKMYPALGGSVSADIIGCGFACNQCWSTYGLAGKDNIVWLHASESAERLIKAATEGERKIVRISHGEPFLYPEHLLEVARLLLEADIPHKPIFQIETNGLHAKPEWIDQLTDLAAAHPDTEGHRGTSLSRIGMWWSMKSSVPAWWVWHTGRPEEDHETMFSNWEYAVENAEGIWIGTAVFPELLQSDEEFDELVQLADELRDGAGEWVFKERFKTYFPYERDVDRRMGARRLKAVSKLLEDNEMPAPTEFDKANPMNPARVMGNGLFPPFPRPKK